jgi:Flp pilus assembly pilin Flp
MTSKACKVKLPVRATDKMLRSLKRTEGGGLVEYAVLIVGAAVLVYTLMGLIGGYLNVAGGDVSAKITASNSLTAH